MTLQSHTETKIFFYETEEERKQHIEFMKQEGYSNNGQLKSNIGTLDTPEYTWCGCFFKQLNK